MAQTMLRPEAETTTSKSPVNIQKLGHVVLWVSDVERSVKFYTEILNMRVSDWDKGTSGPIATWCF
jgi:predicted enzyme related to lactoylglutathione lyase